MTEVRPHKRKPRKFSLQKAQCWYPASVDRIRKEEYPLLQGALPLVCLALWVLIDPCLLETTYLDHAGTTPYPGPFVKAFAKDMKSNLFGNPHSQSPSSILSTERIESSRIRLLRFFKADPIEFDLVFVANATAAIKLVVECMVDFSSDQGKTDMWYGYHGDSHTSLVGPRELTSRYKCFVSDEQVEEWLGCIHPLPDEEVAATVGLFAFPGQSNMNGRRLPLHWPKQLRYSEQPRHRNIYSLLDAAALASTSPVDLGDASSATDFTAVSLYKIFGFPDLGALIVRKAASHLLVKRRYFGGGTVDMVINGDDPSSAWSVRKESLHERLEDGTPAFHSIAAVDLALTVHKRLYGSMENVSKYTCALSKILFDGMNTLKHDNGLPLCKVYAGSEPAYGDRSRQGPTIAFNVKNAKGDWVGKSDIEQFAIMSGIQLRTGGVCNPGGIAASLDLNPTEMKENFAEGLRCGNEVDVLNTKPTGIVRVSLGAMSSVGDVERFLDFLDQLVERQGHASSLQPVCALRQANTTVDEDNDNSMLPIATKGDDIRYRHGISCPLAGCSTISMSRDDKTRHYLSHQAVMRYQSSKARSPNWWRNMLSFRIR
ncbi:MAG: hypothetical protein Q9217_004861 [Psora testacea]